MIVFIDILCKNEFSHKCERAPFSFMSTSVSSYYFTNFETGTDVEYFPL